MALLVTAGTILGAWGCGVRPGPGSGIHEDKGQDGVDDRLCVVTTIFPYYDFVRQIAGDRVKLKLVVPAGMDSHSFEPTPADSSPIQAGLIGYKPHEDTYHDGLCGRGGGRACGRHGGCP